MRFRSEDARGRTEWAFREEGTGREVIFTDVELTPLSYDDLVGAKSNKALVIPLEWRNAKIVRSEIPGIEAEQFASVNASLESNFTSKGIGLVRGGWLPFGLAVTGDIVVLLDRCIVVDLVGRFRDGVKRQGEGRDLLDLFDTAGIRINPLLYALEGRAQENPTLELVADQIEWAARRLQAALPKASLVATDERGLQGLMGIIRDMQTSMAQKEMFLLRLAPQIAAPVSREKRDALWGKVLNEARDCGVETNSLVVLATLSAISVPNGGSPARRLLKFKPGYADKDARNALADLRSIELLLALFALFPEQRVMLCTADRDLALFWAGIRASDFSSDAGRASFNLSPSDALLPGDALARWLAAASR